MKRKVILNLAMSLDGYIADEKGGYDWIEGDGDKSLNSSEQFDFARFMDGVDLIVMGRKAYEECDMKPYKEKQVIVATHQDWVDYDNIRFVGDDIVEVVKALQQEEGRDIWLFGGGGLVENFLKADIIDEYIVGIIPIILGKGRPLFPKDSPRIKLHLDSYTVDEGLPILRYSKR